MTEGLVYPLRVEGAKNIATILYIFLPHIHFGTAPLLFSGRYLIMGG